MFLYSLTCSLIYIEYAERYFFRWFIPVLISKIGVIVLCAGTWWRKTMIAIFIFSREWDVDHIYKGVAGNEWCCIFPFFSNFILQTPFPTWSDAAFFYVVFKLKRSFLDVLEINQKVLCWTNFVLVSSGKIEFVMCW